MKKERFWDMKQVLERHSEGYCDWEGFASGDGLEEKVREAIQCFRFETDDKEIIQIVGDLVMHYAYVCVDQSDMVPTVEVLVEVAWMAHAMVSTGMWMKSGIKW